MGGINVSRMIVGGIVAGLVMFLCEGLASMLYQNDMNAALAVHNLSMPMTRTVLLESAAISLLSGLTLIFFYAAARPRFGPGPKTALTVALVLWLGSYVVALLGWCMLGLFPTRMFVLWGAVGLIEMIIATQVGAWIYRE